MARRRIDLREPWRAILAEVRPDLTADEHLVLIECVLHLVRQVSQYRQASGPSGRRDRQPRGHVPPPVDRGAHAEGGGPGSCQGASGGSLLAQQALARPVPER